MYECMFYIHVTSLSFPFINASLCVIIHVFYASDPLYKMSHAAHKCGNFTYPCCNVLKLCMLFIVQSLFTVLHDSFQRSVDTWRHWFSVAVLLSRRFCCWCFCCCCFYANINIDVIITVFDISFQVDSHSRHKQLSFVLCNLHDFWLLLSRNMLH